MVQKLFMMTQLYVAFGVVGPVRFILRRPWQYGTWLICYAPDGGGWVFKCPPKKRIAQAAQTFQASSRQVKLAWGQSRQTQEFWIGSVAILESFVEIVLISPWKICILKSFWLPLMEPDEMLMWRLQGSAQWFAGKISCSSSGHHLPRKLALLKTSISQIYLVLLDVSPFSGFLYCWVLWSCEASGISFGSALPRFKCASGVDPATACAMYAALAPFSIAHPAQGPFMRPLKRWVTTRCCSFRHHS